MRIPKATNNTKGMKDMKEAMLEIWCELWEAIWKGFKTAITVLVAIAVIFNVLVKKKDKPAVVEQAMHTVQKVAQ